MGVIQSLMDQTFNFIEKAEIDRRKDELIDQELKKR